MSFFISLYPQMLSLSTNIKEAYKHGRDDEQNFIQNLSLFLCTFLKEHGNLVEKKTELHETLLEALHYLILISEVEETEIFKICLEYWNALASDLYRENPFGSCNPLLLSRPSQPSELPSRRQLYNPVLTKVRNKYLEWLTLHLVRKGFKFKSPYDQLLCEKKALVWLYTNKLITQLKWHVIGHTLHVTNTYTIFRGLAAAPLIWCIT